MALSIQPRTTIAVVWRDTSGEISLTRDLDAIPDGTLECITKSDDGWELVPIAKIQDRKIQLTDHAARVPAGSIVYHVSMEGK